MRPKPHDSQDRRGRSLSPDSRPQIPRPTPPRTPPRTPPPRLPQRRLPRRRRRRPRPPPTPPLPRRRMPRPRPRMPTLRRTGGSAAAPATGPAPPPAAPTPPVRTPSLRSRRRSLHIHPSPGVFITSTFYQCLPIAKSRGYGCSAPYSQGGGTDAGLGTMWSGPYCCGSAAASECVQFSDTYSQCKPCNAVYEQVRPPAAAAAAAAAVAAHPPPPLAQCGGTIPGSDVAWNGHGRAACCQTGSYCKCVLPPAPAQPAIPSADAASTPRAGTSTPTTGSATPTATKSLPVALPLLPALNCL